MVNADAQEPRRVVLRAHAVLRKDRIEVTHESPEAIAETLWVRFFPHLHDPHRPSVLDRATSNPTFERFYTDHIRKLLWGRGRTRQAAPHLP